MGPSAEEGRASVIMHECLHLDVDVIMAVAVRKKRVWMCEAKKQNAREVQVGWLWEIVSCLNPTYCLQPICRVT